MGPPPERPSSYARLRTLSEQDLIKLVDDSMVHTMIGFREWVDELSRRRVEQQSARSFQVAIVSLIVAGVSMVAAIAAVVVAAS
jgi:hypothetical protein